MSKSMPSAKRQGAVDRYGPFCFYCGTMLDVSSPLLYHIDHVVPKSSGGSNSADNLVPSCKSCNLTKGSRSVDRLRSVLAFDAIGAPRYSDNQVDDIKTRFGINIVPSYTFFFEIMGYETTMLDSTGRGRS